ncbi:MAG: exopolyphosphatase [Sphingomonadales bacterium]
MNKILTRNKGHAKHAGGVDNRPIGVIDIGSNSVRMVVYEGLIRSPQALFNEKVLCGLGRSVGKTGLIDDAAFAMALTTLKRFAHLASDMGLRHLEAVATAAVRDAANGADFLRAVKRECGLSVRLLSGEEEARYSALGVIAGVPDVDGVVGDLGGGSLELIEVNGGVIGRRCTLPIGPVRILGENGKTGAPLAKRIDDVLATVPWLAEMKGKPLYVVGGSWRALARVEINLKSHALAILHQYHIARADIDPLCQAVQGLGRKNLKKMRGVSEARIPTLPIAGTILQRLAVKLNTPHVIVSALGLREGLLYEQLAPAVQAEDPLLSACQDLARRLGRFPEHGELVMRWLDALFADHESDEDLRLRRAVCLLSDIGWRGHPDFRAERAIYESLYGWFVGIDAHGRAIMGLALFICFGGNESDPTTAIFRALLPEAERRRAIALGRAVRLAQRLSAGTPGPLAASRLMVDGGQVVLEIDAQHRSLIGDVVERRLANLASALGLKPAIRAR